MVDMNRGSQKKTVSDIIGSPIHVYILKDINENFPSWSRLSISSSSVQKIIESGIIRNTLPSNEVLIHGLPFVSELFTRSKVNHSLPGLDSFLQIPGICVALVHSIHIDLIPTTY